MQRVFSSFIDDLKRFIGWEQENHGSYSISAAMSRKPAITLDHCSIFDSCLLCSTKSICKKPLLCLIPSCSRKIFHLPFLWAPPQSGRQIQKMTNLEKSDVDESTIGERGYDCCYYILWLLANLPSLQLYRVLSLGIVTVRFQEYDLIQFKFKCMFPWALLVPLQYSILQQPQLLHISGLQTIVNNESGFYTTTHRRRVGSRLSLPIMPLQTTVARLKDCRWLSLPRISWEASWRRSEFLKW